PLAEIYFEVIYGERYVRRISAALAFEVGADGFRPARYVERYQAFGDSRDVEIASLDFARERALCALDAEPGGARYAAPEVLRAQVRELNFSDAERFASRRADRRRYIFHFAHGI